MRPAVLSDEAEVERFGIRSDQLRHHVDHRAHLVVPVRRRLHDRAVHPHGHVVHECAAVDAAEIDAPFMPVAERVERADDVVAVDAEVEGEVVPGAGGNAHVREIVLGRDRGDRGL